MLARSLRAGLALACLLAASLSPAGVRADQSGGAYRLVRFDGRITDSMRAGIEATGSEVVGYTPTDSYVVWADDAAARATARLERVAAVGTLPAAWKIHPTLERMTARGRIEVAVHPTAAARMSARLGTALSSDLAPAGRGILRLAADLAPAAARALASDPAVLSVQAAGASPVPLDEATAQVVAGNLNAGRTSPVTGYPQWLAGLGLDGAGVRVSVSDSGISQLHPDLDDRVVARFDYTGFPPGAQPDIGRDEDGHGTHVAGIVAGAPGTPVLRDGGGFAYGQGIAPAVTLVDQKIFGQIQDSFPTITELLRDASRAGTSIMNASWGYTDAPRGGYDAMAQEVDGLARDADPATAGLQEYLMVFAAGNEGTAGPLRPQEAKNILTVGATWSGRPGLEAEPLLISPNAGIDDIWGRSSRGPTADGRIFPSVVAPGAAVASARSPEGIWNCPPTDAAGAGLYTECSGTSMAAPHATGAAALVHQWWRRAHGSAPSPAMVRALLVNGARDVGGRDVPNVHEGWGRIDLGRTLSSGPGLWIDQSVVLEGPGSRASFEVVTDGTRPLRATVAWTDAPGAGGPGPALVNDLDLVVERLDSTDRWLGNAFEAGRSVTEGAPDRLNNLENVFLDAPAPGRYRVTVAAFNVPDDAIPDNADETEQDFALVIRA